MIANARMYGVTAPARAAWRDLFDWLARSTGITLEVIDHAYPAPLTELWSRRDLACAFICGFPLCRDFTQLKPVAAPIPASPPSAGRALYATALVVRAAAPFASLAESFGHRVGFTTPDSHSGFNALRHHLLPSWTSRRQALYREAVGPLITPRRVLEAVLDGAIDVGPLDSYALDLMLADDSGLRDTIRVLEMTEAAPIPCLAASAECDEEVIVRLRQGLIAASDDAVGAVILRRLALQGFAAVSRSDYGVIAAWDDEARAAGFVTSDDFARGP
jgi:ABC-type phosphate/phosphonate transport system substrate-binding protein